MGRPKAVKTVGLHKCFELNEEEIIADGKILPPKSNIWKELCKKFPPMTSKSVYTAALKWWNSMGTKNDETCIGDLGTISIMVKSTDSDETELSIEEIKVDSQKFKIELSAKVWETISPVKRDYARKNIKGVRTYNVLKPGVWTNVIVDEITKKRRNIQCVWAFETNKCYHSGEDFVTFRAKCKACDAILCGVIENEPNENESVILNVEIRGINARAHEVGETKKVRIGSERAKQLYAINKPS